jgi:hypothetical protein
MPRRESLSSFPLRRETAERWRLPAFALGNQTCALLTKVTKPPCVHHPSSVSIPSSAKSRAKPTLLISTTRGGAAKGGRTSHSRLLRCLGNGVSVSIAQLTAEPSFAHATTTPSNSQ